MLFFFLALGSLAPVAILLPAARGPRVRRSSARDALSGPRPYFLLRCFVVSLYLAVALGFLAVSRGAVFCARLEDPALEGENPDQVLPPEPQPSRIRGRSPAALLFSLQSARHFPTPMLLPFSFLCFFPPWRDM